MKKFTHTARVLLTLTITVLLAGACSSPKYYVFKTIRHTPVEKSEIPQEKLVTNNKDQAPAEDSVAEETILVSTEKAAEALSLSKINRQITEKAKPAQPQKISKLQEIKTAIQVKKEIKKIEKQLDKQGLNQQAPGSQPKSQLVALLLAILVGGLGIHRFYLGYTAIGIIQLLTLGGCGVWALIDLIRIAMDDLRPADGSQYEQRL